MVGGGRGGDSGTFFLFVKLNIFLSHVFIINFFKQSTLCWQPS